VIEMKYLLLVSKLLAMTVYIGSADSIGRFEGCHLG